MKIQRVLILAICCSSLLFLMGCKRISMPSDFPEVGISLSDMNNYIELNAPESINSFNTEGVIELSVRVIGDEPIAFTHDYGARLFIPQNGEWEEVRNFGSYPRGIIIVPPWDNNPRNEGAAGVGPELPDPEKPVLLRIVLIGNVYRNEQVTDERVGAYIDVELKP